MTLREFIVKNPDEIIEDNEVLENVYGSGYIGVEDALDREVVDIIEKSDETLLIIVQKRLDKVD
jgi:hypothetical protein